MNNIINIPENVKDKTNTFQDPSEPTHPDTNSLNKEWPDPLPLYDSSMLPEFPVHALPEFGKDIVDSIVEVVQVDFGLVGSLFLSILSMVLGKKIKVNLSTHKEHVNLYVCIIAGSGERKSSPVAILTAPLIRYQKELRQLYKDEYTKVKTEISSYKKQIKDLEKNASKSDDDDELESITNKINNLKQKIIKTPLPRIPTLLADDITLEALGILMVENSELMSIISSEGGGLFGIIAGIYSDKGCNIDLILKAHSGENWSVNRVTRESQFMDSPILTLGLTIQPYVIDEIKKNKQFKGRGFLARFLYSYCQPKAGYRKRQHKSIPEDIIDKYEKRIMRLAKIPLGDKPIEHELSEEAQGLWDEFYEESETSMQPGNSLELLRDWGSKLPGAVARMAGLLHYAKHDKLIINPIISKETVEAAIKIGEYFREHAKYIFGLMGKDPAIISAGKILEYINEHKPDAFKLRDIMRHKNFFKNTDLIKPGIELLIDKNILKRVEAATNTGGRPEADTYIVNPKYKHP